MRYFSFQHIGLHFSKPKIHLFLQLSKEFSPQICIFPKREVRNCTRRKRANALARLTEPAFARAATPRQLGEVEPSCMCENKFHCLDEEGVPRELSRSIRDKDGRCSIQRNSRTDIYARLAIWRCNWIERFWKTIKYEYIYIQPEDNGTDLFFGIKGFIYSLAHFLQLVERKLLHSQTRMHPLCRNS